MKILAFDSTARVASVAVCEDERLLSQYNIDNGLTQSELLLPMVEDMLKSLKLGIGDIGLFAVTAGPGSFTGVRIGTAIVKGLAFGRDIPCSTVSTLEALAENLCGLSGIVVPVMDARRSQVYTAIFSGAPDTLERLTPDEALSLDVLAERLRAYDGTPIYLVGDGYNVAKGALERLGVKTEDTPHLLISENAYSVARVALRAYRRGEAVTDAEVLPTYLRVPQAERERLERLKENKK